MRSTNLIKKIIVLLAWICVFAGSTTAQDTLRLEEAVATSLRNNYDILLARNDSVVAAINYDYRNAGFYPRVNATGNMLFNNNSSRQKFSDGTERERDGLRTTNLNASLNLNWTVFDGFRMFILREQMDQAIKLGNLNIRNQVINTVSQVITTYFDMVRQRQLIANIDEQVAFSEERLQLSQYKLDIGAGIKPDVLQAQIDRNNRLTARANQLALIDQRRQALNLLMNIPTNVSYEVQDTIPLQTELLLGDLLNGLNETSPALQILQTNRDIAELNIRSTKALRYPTVSLVSAYNFNRSNNNSVINPFVPLFNMNRGFNYGLTATIPIFNNFQVRQQIRQAEQALHFADLQLKSREALLSADIGISYRNYRAQFEIMSLAESNVALARENLHIERERYRLGRTTFIELRQAEENVATALTNLINARYNLKVAETELLRIRGDLVR